MIAGNKIMKSFGSKNVLDNCSFHFELGKTSTIVGESGCGKTTLLKCLSGIEKLDSGEIYITVDNEKIRHGTSAFQEKIGLVMQGGFLWRRKTVLENILFTPNHNRVFHKSDVREKALELLERFHISHTWNKYPENLSGGEQQRAAIIRTIILEPKVLLLDEVTFSLDPKNKLELLELIESLRRKGFTIIMVSHDIIFSKRISDSIHFMTSGTITERILKKDFDQLEPKTEGQKFLNINL